MIGQWMLFENDKCDKCNHPKVVLLTHGEEQLQVIISCNCDTCVFDHQWRDAKNSDQLIVVVDSTINDMLRILAATLEENSREDYSCNHKYDRFPI